MRRRISVLLSLYVFVMLSGCSFRPQEISANTVEKIAREMINPEIYLAEEEPTVEELYDGRHSIYSFRDKRGIPFTVEVNAPHFALDGFKKNLYEDDVYFYTDYRTAIMNYYADQVAEILEGTGGICFDEKDKEIIRISDETALASLEDILQEMDDLYAFDYAHSGEDGLQLAEKVYWKDYRVYDLLIRYNGKQEELFFTVDDEDVLSKESIRGITDRLKMD